MPKKVKQDKQQKPHRHLVAILCGLIIISRIIWPDLKFDDVSLLLFIVGILVLLIPDIGELITRIKKFKKGDLEIEFETHLAELADKTKKVESSAEHEYEIKRSMSVLSNRISELTGDPRGGLVALAVEIESAIFKLAKDYSIPRINRLTSPVRIVDELEKKKLLPQELPVLMREFWDIRNRAVHSVDFKSTHKQLYGLLDLGVRILRLITIKRSYVSYIESAQHRVQFGDDADVIAGANILSQLGTLDIDLPVLRKTLKRKELSEEVRETLKRAIRDLESKRE